METRTKKTIIGIALSLSVPFGVANSASALTSTQSTAVPAESKTMFTTTLVSVRKSPTSNAPVLNKLPKGTKVNVVASQKGWSADKQAKVNWSKISTGGWIRSDYLVASGKSDSQWTTYTTKNTVDVYAKSKVTSGLVFTIPKGAKVQLKEISVGHWKSSPQIWVQVKYKGRTGWTTGYDMFAIAG